MDVNGEKAIPYISLVTLGSPHKVLLLQTKRKVINVTHLLQEESGNTNSKKNSHFPFCENTEL